MLKLVSCSAGNFEQQRQENIVLFWNAVGFPHLGAVVGVPEPTEHRVDDQEAGDEEEGVYSKSVARERRAFRSYPTLAQTTGCD